MTDNKAMCAVIDYEKPINKKSQFIITPTM